MLETQIVLTSNKLCAIVRILLDILAFLLYTIFRFNIYNYISRTSRLTSLVLSY